MLKGLSGVISPTHVWCRCYRRCHADVWCRVVSVGGSARDQVVVALAVVVVAVAVIVVAVVAVIVAALAAVVVVMVVVVAVVAAVIVVVVVFVTAVAAVIVVVVVVVAVIVVVVVVVVAAVVVVVVVVGDGQRLLAVACMWPWVCVRVFVASVCGYCCRHHFADPGTNSLMRPLVTSSRPVHCFIPQGCHARHRSCGHRGCCLHRSRECAAYLSRDVPVSVLLSIRRRRRRHHRWLRAALAPGPLEGFAIGHAYFAR